MIRFPSTLLFYFGMRFLFWIGALSVGIMCLVFMVDLVEMLRQYASKDRVGAGMAVFLSALKMPGLFEKVFPFAFFFGAMWTFTDLSRRNELVVARAAGISAWQFLLPAIVIAIGLGLFMVAVFNPVQSLMTNQYKVLEKTILRGEESRLAISKTGLWLRESLEGNQSVVHALDVSDTPEALRLGKVIVFQYEGQDRLTGRIDAETAVLNEDGTSAWDLSNAWIRKGNAPAVFHERYRLPTTLNRNRIYESFAPPETISFWELRQFIATAEAAGFVVNQHKFHWHSILATPFLLSAMVFIAATFSLRISRFGGVTRLVLAGAGTVFLVSFLSNVAGAFGQSGIIPPALAAWAPASVAGLTGITLLFHLEDG